MMKTRWLGILTLAMMAVGCCTLGGCSMEDIKWDKGDSSVEEKSAYQIWLDAGNMGTEEDFFAWLQLEVGVKEDDVSQGLAYTLKADGKGYSVTGIGECEDTDIIIPSTYEGLPVVSIGEGAFSECIDLTGVVISDSVTTIYPFAFDGCSGLMSVVIGTSVTSIEYSAFADCSSLTSVEIPDCVTSIGDWAFSGCRNLASVKIGDGVTNIGEHAFLGCSNLTSVVIGKNVTRIGSDAFSSGSLTIYITDIEAWCKISGILNLMGYHNNKLYLNNELITRLTIPNGITCINEAAFSGCTSLTSVEIPDSVTSIGEDAFYGCESLTSVVIPDSVTSIGDCAFDGCYSLTSVVIGNGVISIGEDAFYDCESLISVVIPDSVISIGEKAFWGCESLIRVVIPDSVISIGEDVFEGCENLTAVYYQGTEKEWNNMLIGQTNDKLTSVTRYYYSEVEMAGCWYYDENGVPTLW